ncbi:MAG: toll/interleukin-1 receptor domain-containing protein [Betaproteobacteria bacterium]|nr:MAG: toll/interleukin-1 receptor domain-containing protein [Betaproteobacteria bacterium]
MNIFISYRRSESSGYSGRLFDRLRSALPDADVFIDVERIEPGQDWRAKLAERIRAADVVLVLVGDEWLSLRDESGRRRIDDPDDVTRWELESALAQGKRLVPVLLDDAAPLQPKELPAALAPLASLQFVRIRHDAFDAGLEDLIARLTGTRLRDEAQRARGRWLVERAKRWSVPVIALAIVLFAWTRLFDLFTLDTRIATWTLALADAAAPVPLDERLALVAIAPEANDPAPDMRARYGELVAALAGAGARSVVLDIHFHASKGGDAALAAAMRRARSLGTQVFFSFVDTQAGKPRAVPELDAAASAAGLACAGRRLGYALSIPIAYGLHREGDEWRAQPHPSLAMLGALGTSRIIAVDPEARALEVDVAGKSARYRFSILGAPVAGAQACAAIKPGTRTAEMLLRLGPAARMRERRVAFEDVLAGRVPQERLAGKTVIVGFETVEETFRIAHGFARETRFGYELQAAAVNVLMQRRITRFAGPAAQIVIAGIFATLGAAIGVRFRQLSRARTALLLGGAAVSYLALAVALAASEDLLLNSAYDISALVFACVLFRQLARRWLQ